METLPSVLIKALALPLCPMWAKALPAVRIKAVAKMSRTRTEAIRIHGLQQPAVSLLINEASKVCPTLMIEKPKLSSLVRSWGMSAKTRYPDIPFSGEWINFDDFIV